MDEEASTQYKSLTKENRKTTSINKDTPDFTYEHFPVVCPSCDGSGTIEEDASHMVTFVPVKDERLRPAWTKVKIAILIVIIMVITGCTTFFLYPRTVTIEVNDHKIITYSFQTSSPWIQYSFVRSVSNQNFFSIILKQFTMQMLYFQVIVSNLTFLQDIHVGMRTVQRDVITMNASYNVNSDVGQYIKKECYVHRNYVTQLMVSFAELSYIMHSQHIQSKDNYFYTDCDTMIFPLPMVSTTTRPPSTTTTTTTRRRRKRRRTTATSAKSLQLIKTPKNYLQHTSSLITANEEKLSYSRDQPVQHDNNIGKFQDQT